MDIGRMDKRVTFLERREVADELGQNRQGMAEVCTVWASIAPTRGGEYYEAQKLREELTWKIYVRFLPGITADMAIRYKERVFQIKSVIDVNFRQRTLEIMCTEYVGKEGEGVGGNTDSGGDQGINR